VAPTGNTVCGACRGLRFEPDVEDKEAAKEEEEGRERRTMERTLSNRTYRTHVSQE
jgi:hypothetical protein